MSKTHITSRVEEDVWRRFKDIATKRKVTTSQLLRQAVRELIKNAKD